MKALYIDELVRAVGGNLSRCTGTVDRVTGVGTDSRRIALGDVYIPLIGERFDGHDFIPQALESGASGLVVERHRVNGSGDDAGFVIEVDDTTRALGRLATFLRRMLPARVIGVTGSGGKTTTKTMIEHLLRKAGRRVVAAPKSFNNRIGVPLTLLQADVKTQYVVVEMGTNAPGEIAELAQIARPDVAAITNIGPSHLEKLGSLDGVMREKGAIFEGMAEGGVGVLNFDDERCRRLADRAPGWFVSYGLAEDADVRAFEVTRRSGSDGFDVQLADGTRFALPAAGRHNVTNALAAIACCVALEMEPRETAPLFASYRPPEMRMNVRALDGGTVVIDDVYNANPMSLAAAMDELRDRRCGGRRVCIVGDMLELGSEGARWHERAGRQAASNDFDLLVTVGELARRVADGAIEAGMRQERVHCYADRDAAAGAVPTLIQPGDTILVKGSRRVGLERVVQEIESLTAARL